MMLLVKPSLKYKKNYITALKELLSRSGQPEVLTQEINNFDAHLKEIKNAEKGIAKTPRSEYWLIDGNKYIGMIQIRHKPMGRYPGIKSHIYYEISPSQRGKGYGKRILAFGLKKAKKLGLNEVIVSCHDGNFASRRII
ncbi:MAG: GNAT family N-acetyltransferase, partial [bacterium]|nr:GNAT family N-acetyltransferase [bacterium]